MCSEHWTPELLSALHLSAHMDRARTWGPRTTRPQPLHWGQASAQRVQVPQDSDSGGPRCACGDGPGRLHERQACLSVQGVVERHQPKGGGGGFTHDRGGKGWRQASLAPHFVPLMSSQHAIPATGVMPLVGHSPVPQTHPAPDLLRVPPCILARPPLPHLRRAHGSPWLPDSAHTAPSPHSAPGPRASLPRSWLR